MSDNKELIGRRMDELAREITTPNPGDPGDPRQNEIVEEIMRLQESFERNIAMRRNSSILA